jgi:hypothetical protein
MDDERECNYAEEYGESFSIGNLLTNTIIEEFIEPTLEEYKKYIIE